MRRHSFDPVSFVFGMIFATIGLVFLTGRVDLGDLHLRWIWPIPLIALGLALLLTAHRRDVQEQAAAAPSLGPPEPIRHGEHPRDKAAEPEPEADEEAESVTE